MNPEMKESRLNIDGMQCENCLEVLKTSLMSLEGVEHTDVDLSVGEARVFYDENKVGINEVKEAINNAGYTVKG